MSNALDPKARCDTTIRLAKLAFDVSTIGRYAGFQTHHESHGMVRHARGGGIMQKDASGN